MILTMLNALKEVHRKNGDQYLIVMKDRTHGDNFLVGCASKEDLKIKKAHYHDRHKTIVDVIDLSHPDDKVE